MLRQPAGGGQARHGASAAAARPPRRAAEPARASPATAACADARVHAVTAAPDSRARPARHRRRAAHVRAARAAARTLSGLEWRALAESRTDFQIRLSESRRLRPAALGQPVLRRAEDATARPSPAPAPQA